MTGSSERATAGSDLVSVRPHDGQASESDTDSANKVSIVLPTLNERHFVYDCLSSLCRQDYTGLSEILVVDGGSTDGTREIVARWGSLFDSWRIPGSLLPLR